MPGDVGGRGCVREMERDGEGVEGLDGTKEFARDSGTRRGSGGTSTHPKRAVSMAVSKRSGVSVEPEMNTSPSSRPESLGSAGRGSVNDEMVARRELS